MLERLNQAMDHLERHLDQPVKIADAGADRVRVGAPPPAAVLRPGRHSAVGVRASAEAHRRRRGGPRREAPLLDVAVRWGYGSNEAFARAFRAVHGVGPARPGVRGRCCGRSPGCPSGSSSKGAPACSTGSWTKDAFRLVGRKARVPLVHEGMNPAIVAFLKGIAPETVRRIEALSDQEPRGIVNVSDGLAGYRAKSTELDYRDAGQCSALRGGGEGPRGRAAKARAWSKPGRFSCSMYWRRTDRGAPAREPAK